jgi:hypothetical protein
LLAIFGERHPGGRVCKRTLSYLLVKFDELMNSHRHIPTYPKPMGFIRGNGREGLTSTRKPNAF